MEIPFNNKLSGLNPTNNTNHTRGHISALIKGGKIVSYAESSLAGKSKFCLNKGRSCHSEIALLKKLKDIKKNKISKYIIWNIRWTKEGKIANSKPCLNCQISLRKAGIQTIVYSTDSGIFIKNKLECIECYSSSGFRY
ncbi:MAG: hypothetical protein CBD97_02125 [Pelagibacteraceae bacterium TMED237]|nr:MAG: hypothetical protein CBD97_02125 [Pelagibacteraceae bacterium TMED237]|tara:strand:+ start:483 stop:899 length:417 start_codon:yes stop_codon:yes gene_type:complete